MKSLAQKAFIEGFALSMTEPELKALLDGCERDDSRLVQGCTTTPPPLMCVQDWPVEAACAIAYSAWHGSDLATVGEVEKRFATLCFDADQFLKEPAGCRHFLNAWDDTPRSKIFAAVAHWCQEALDGRVNYENAEQT